MTIFKNIDGSDDFDDVYGNWNDLKLETGEKNFEEMFNTTF